MASTSFPKRSPRRNGPLLWWLIGMMAALLMSACSKPAPKPPAKPAPPVPATSSAADSAASKPHTIADTGPATVAPTIDSVPASEPPAEHVALSDGTQGKELYARHCAACHGENGDGVGVAARFVFPKPRDFRAGRFRLVSTTNRVPSREDLDAVLMRGMPGSSMPSWAHLTKDERSQLIDEVLRMWAAGQRDTYIAVLKDQDDLTDEEIAEPDVQAEIQQFVQRKLTPGEVTDVPSIGEPTPEAIERGKVLYVAQACQSCHGKDGRGDGVQKMVDDEKLPTTARDFTLAIFKGGDDAASLYRRIAYGMPGTPMPSSSKMTPDEMVDLVHFVRSLSDEETRRASVLRREHLVAKRVSQLPADGSAPEWGDVATVRLRTTPLWWRNSFNPIRDALDVQAVHDGQSIMLRLSWLDETRDEHASTSQSFEDAVAFELYGGDAEPFIGMGGPNAPVDVWFWDADRQAPQYAVEDQYPNTVVDIYPLNETVVETGDYARPGTKLAAQPDLSLPAKAVGNPIVPASTNNGSSNLTVGGPSSITFRPPQSQLVTAHGEWADGRWTVVMTRPLTVPSPDDGVSLKPGDKVSAAFALWNGSLHDRDGQKLITIWQDFELEP